MPQRPVAAHGAIGARLILAPAEAALDLLVGLLDPIAQPVEPHDLDQWCVRQACDGFRATTYGTPRWAKAVRKP